MARADWLSEGLPVFSAESMEEYCVWGDTRVCSSMRFGREYCYWAASLESPGEPLKEFAAFSRAKVADEGVEDKDEPAYKRSRS